MDQQARQRRLVAALSEPGALPSSGAAPAQHETHISHVLLAGAYAYKLKKPLNLGFLDFSSLEARRTCCEAEIRLNQRLAPRVYLDVVAITGSPDAPVVDGAGPAIEYAVRMHRFDQDGLFDRLVQQGRLDRASIEALAQRVAHFHEAAAHEPPEADLGTPERVVAPARDNFDHIRPHADAALARRLDALADWTETRFEVLRAVFERRRRRARVRECHGDMHLGNIVLIDRVPAIFDGIEFNAAMRWTDVVADVAFLVMDLDSHGASDLAGIFLDEWLAVTGDYDGLAVMTFYLVYRALVRAKIAAIRLEQQPGEADRQGAYDELVAYVALAERYARANAPALLITHGVAGCGKSAAARVLVERVGAVRLPADIERKRLYPDPDPEVRYAPAAHAATYQRLEALARGVATAGFAVIVDATFLERWRRDRMRAIAAEHGVPFAILSIRVSEALLRERLASRYASGADASEAGPAVMADQSQRLEVLDAAEAAQALIVDNSGARPLVPATGLAHGRGLDADSMG